LVHQVGEKGYHYFKIHGQQNVNIRQIYAVMVCGFEDSSTIS